MACYFHGSRVGLYDGGGSCRVLELVVERIYG